MVGSDPSTQSFDQTSQWKRSLRLQNPTKQSTNPQNVCPLRFAIAVSIVLQQRQMSSAKCASCSSTSAIYTCPRCFARTCSHPCYLAHNPACVQAFERSEMESEMKGLRSEGEMRRKMVEILERVKGEMETEDLPWNASPASGEREREIEGEREGDVSSSLARRMEEACLSFAEKERESSHEGEREIENEPEKHTEKEGETDTDTERERERLADQIVSHLEDTFSTTEIEAILRSEYKSRSEFRDLVRESVYTEEWKPWWGERERDMVEIGERVAREDVDTEVVRRRTPSDAVNIHVLEVLIWYCTLLRHYNGDISSPSLRADFLSLLLRHCRVLSPSLSPLTNLSLSVWISLTATGVLYTEEIIASKEGQGDTNRAIKAERFPFSLVDFGGVKSVRTGVRDVVEVLEGGGVCVRRAMSAVREIVEGVEERISGHHRSLHKLKFLEAYVYAYDCTPKFNTFLPILKNFLQNLPEESESGAENIKEMGKIGEILSVQSEREREKEREKERKAGKKPLIEEL